MDSVNSKLTVAQLKKKLSELGVKIPSKAKKAELVQILQEKEEGYCSGESFGNDDSENSQQTRTKHLSDKYDSENSQDSSAKELSCSKANKLDVVARLLFQNEEEACSGAMPSMESSSQATSSKSQSQAVEEVSDQKRVWVVETRVRESRCFQPEVKWVGIYTNKEDAIRNAEVFFRNMSLYEVLYTEEQDKWEENSARIGPHGGVLCMFDWVEGEGEELGIAIRRADLDREFENVHKDDDDLDASSDSDDDSCWSWDGRHTYCRCAHANA